MDEIPSEKEVRLLSCNSDAAAKELSKHTKREFYASNGVVTIYPDGTLRHGKPFRKYHKGARSDVGEISVSTQKRTDRGIKLGDNVDDDTWKYMDPEVHSGNSYTGKSLEPKYTTGSSAEFEKGVTYLNDIERQEYEVFVQHDRIVDGKGNLVDTTESVSVLADKSKDISNKAIFVMSEDGKIYISTYNEVGKFHHSSFLSGKKIAAAGEIQIKNGLIKLVTNESGHYKPSITMIKDNLLKELNSRYYFFAGDNIEDNIKFTSGF